MVSTLRKTVQAMGGELSLVSQCRIVNLWCSPASPRIYRTEEPSGGNPVRRRPWPIRRVYDQPAPAELASIEEGLTDFLGLGSQ